MMKQTRDERRHGPVGPEVRDTARQGLRSIFSTGRGPNPLRRSQVSMGLRGALVFQICGLGLSLIGCGGENDAESDTPSILDELGRLEGVTVQEDEDAAFAAHRVFRLRIRQPLDHDDPAAGDFTQHVVLTHRDREAPVVLATNGYFLQYYWRYPFFGSIEVAEVQLLEPTGILGANQIEVEHRYYGESKPRQGRPADAEYYRYLSVEQSAQDLHRIVETLKAVYPGRWLSTGVSKGGKTALIHRKYYPDDVYATVAYVAPASLGLQDERYARFLENVGSQECREALASFQRGALATRDAVVPVLRSALEEMEISLSHEDVDRRWESAVVNAAFEFWQYLGRNACDEVPRGDASVSSLVAFIDRISPIQLWAPEVSELFDPYRRQVVTELGYPAVPVDHLAGQLRYWEDFDDDELAGFDPLPMRAVVDWVASSAERTLLIYGGDDPWTAGAFEVPASGDNHRWTIPEAVHDVDFNRSGQAIENTLIERLAEWMGHPVDPGTTRRDLRSVSQPWRTPPMRLSVIGR